MWEELRIDPTQDTKAIRRAYAARLKQIDPDRNPQGFMRLRAAFEAALDGARQGRPVAATRVRLMETSEPERLFEAKEPSTAQRESEGEGEEDEPQKARPLEASEPSQILTLNAEQRARFRDVDPDAALVAKLEQALARKETGKAIELYGRVAASGALSLKAAPALRDKLLALAAGDRNVDRDQIMALVEAFAWDKLSERDETTSETRDRVNARLAAEHWYDALLADASNRKRKKRRAARVANILLGRRHLHRFTKVDVLRLKEALDAYELHHTWLPGRFDPDKIAVLKRTYRRRATYALTFYLVVIGALFLNGVRLAFKSFEASDATSWILVAELLVVGCVILWLVNAIERLLLQYRRSTGDTAPAALSWLAGARLRLHRWFRKARQDGRT